MQIVHTARRARPGHAERRPQETAVDRETEGKMDAEAVVADIGSVDVPDWRHEPADHAHRGPERYLGEGIHCLRSGRAGIVRALSPTHHLHRRLKWG